MISGLPMKQSEVALAEAVADFSDRFDPMVVKELRQGLRARWFVVPFIGVQAAAIALLWLEAMAVRQRGSAFASESLGHVLFWGLVYVVVGVVLPLRSLTVLGGDASGDEVRLILLTGLSRWRIVMGKWVTQMVLSGLVILSLVPYGLVRYFFGGVEFMPNLITLVAAFGFSAAMNALLIGAAGYSSYWMRLLIGVVALMYAGGPAAVVLVMGWKGESLSQGLGTTPEVLMSLWFGLGMVLVFAYFTLAGLQLARAKLRTGTHPWEVGPARPVLTLFFLVPLYFGVLSAITCGFGFPVVAGAMLWWMWSLDPADRPVRSELHFVHPSPRITPKKYWF